MPLVWIVTLALATSVLGLTFTGRSVEIGRLAAADRPQRPTYPPAGELREREVAGVVAVALGGMALLSVLKSPPAGLLWAVGTALAAHTWQARRQTAWARALDEQAFTLARHLRLRFREGVGPAEALRRALEDLDHLLPLADEVAHVVQRYGVGERLPDVLRELGRHPRYREAPVMRGVWRHLGVAVSEYLPPDQMADMLDRYLYVAELARELQGELRAELTIARLTRSVVSLIPPAVLLVFRVLAPEFWTHLTGEPAGNLALGVAGLLVVAANLVGRRMSEMPVVEV